MKKILLACLVATSLAGIYGCESMNSTLQPGSADEILGAARIGAQMSGQVGGGPITPVSASTLPASITDYVSKNYAGYTVDKAGKSAEGNFLVVLENANRDHKALIFGADGAFKQEVALMQGPGRPGTHGRPGDHGGPGGRGPNSFTAIDVASLPATITNYVTSKYASSTISGAAQNAEKLYVVFVKTATDRTVLEFNADGSFKQEVVRMGKGRGSFTEITAAELPKNVTDYISATFTGSSIKKAAKSNVDGGFVVWITKADGTNTGLSFGADGAFKQELKCTKNQKPTS